jgi:hypothetical protein
LFRRLSPKSMPLNSSIAQLTVVLIVIEIHYLTVSM